MMHRIERTFAGRTLSIETGRMAKQAAGSALVTYGETMILAAVTVSAVLVVLGNLLADLLRTWADPRLSDV